jgi:hypothetical protein
MATSTNYKTAGQFSLFFQAALEKKLFRARFQKKTPISANHNFSA